MKKIIRCQRCGRILTSEPARKIGYGSECLKIVKEKGLPNHRLDEYGV